ncbi:MAG: hypothetical protein ACP5H7_00530 [Minisyncoccia bacterium]
MELTNRQKTLVKIITKEYIKSANPISSSFIINHYNFGIKEAMIRKEMQKLGKLGFITKPHTSGGRIPTNKGYKFLIEEFLKENSEQKFNYFEDFKILFKNDNSLFNYINTILESLKKLSSSLIILNFLEKDFLLKDGWEKVTKEPEFKEKDVYLEFIEFTERFQDKIKGLNKIFKKVSKYEKKELKPEKKIKVFVGKENPFLRTDKFSIIMSSCCFGKEDRIIISFLGPKRMYYDKNIRLLKSLINLVENI